MTNQEASKIIKDGLEDMSLDYFDDEQYEALTMAIQTLSQEPSGDLISRAEAINALGYDISIESDEGLDKYKSVIKEMICKIYDVQKANIEKLPSVNPQEPVLDKIRADIEKAKEDFYYDEHDLGVRAGFRFALEIIDKYRKEQG